MGVVYRAVVRRAGGCFFAGIRYSLDDENVLTPVEVSQVMNKLNEVLTRIGEDYRENIQDDSRNYLEISIAKKAEELGFAEVGDSFRDAYAIIPLKNPVSGMKVRIDGRTFVNYAQLKSGIVVPNYVASQADLPFKAYVAKDSMICNFA